MKIKTFTTEMEIMVHRNLNIYTYVLQTDKYIILDKAFVLICVLVLIEYKLPCTDYSTIVEWKIILYEIEIITRTLGVDV